MLTAEYTGERARESPAHETGGYEERPGCTLEQGCTSKAMGTETSSLALGLDSVQHS